MIEQYVDVPMDTTDDDKYNGIMDRLKSKICDKYGGYEVRIIVRRVRT